MFIIIGLFMTVAAMFFGIMFTSGMTDGWKKNVLTIVIALAIGFGISGLICFENQANVNAWNNGYCEECGGEWHLAGAVESRIGDNTRYYWECKDCYNLIDTTRNFK